MLKFVEGENPLTSVLKFLKPVSSHELKINLFVRCCEKWKLYFRFNYIFLIACEVCMCMLLRKEWGVRVCGDVILFNFWSVLQKFFLKLPYWDFTEPEAVCDIYIRNFRVISMRFSYVILCGVYTYFCAVLWCSCPPYAPLRKPKKMADGVRWSMQSKLLPHNTHQCILGLVKRS